jgi:hypothetical protein
MKAKIGQGRYVYGITLDYDVVYITRRPHAELDATHEPEGTLLDDGTILHGEEYEQPSLDDATVDLLVHTRRAAVTRAEQMLKKGMAAA